MQLDCGISDRLGVKMGWVVTGQSGQLGRSLLQALEMHGISFTGISFSLENLEDRREVIEYIKREKPTVIINCAAWTNVESAETNPIQARIANTDLVEYLASAAKSVNAILAHISTDYVFSGSTDRPWLEDGITNPLSVYGKTKADGESRLLRDYSERSYIFRTSWLYSAYGKNFAKTMTKLALKDSSIVTVVDDQIGQPTFAGDLAEQIITSITAEIPFGIYHGTNTGSASWFEFAQEIFRLTGADVSRVSPIPSNKYVQLAVRPKYSVLGQGKWETVGFQTMRPWHEALVAAFPTILNECR